MVMIGYRRLPNLPLAAAFCFSLHGELTFSNQVIVVE
jgi:hypothetical protein